MIELVADIRVPAILVVGCAYFIAALCFFGLICKNYHDNFGQMVGLMLIIVWALGRANMLGDRENLTLEQILAWRAWQTLPRSDTVSFYQLLGVSGVALFGAGTAWKVWKYRKHASNPNGVVK